MKKKKKKKITTDGKQKHLQGGLSKIYLFPLLICIYSRTKQFALLQATVSFQSRNPVLVGLVKCKSQRKSQSILPFSQW